MALESHAFWLQLHHWLLSQQSLSINSLCLKDLGVGGQELQLGVTLGLLQKIFELLSHFCVVNDFTDFWVERISHLLYLMFLSKKINKKVQFLFIA